MRDNRQELIPRNQRVCRFCGKKNPDTYFRKDAHLIPQLLGNKKLLSDHECDSCNKLFGIQYEDNLANFLGVARTLSMNQGQNGIPKFVSPDKSISIKEEVKNSKSFIFNESEGSGSIDYSNANSTIITAIKHSYIPLSVYKAILKVAISLIDDKLEDYSRTIEFLMTNKLDKFIQNNPLIGLHRYFIPGPSLEFPMSFSFIKNISSQEEKNLVPSRAVVICFQNWVYQIFIPFDSKDEHFERVGKEIIRPILPPFIDKKWILTYGKPKPEWVDLSSNSKVKGQKDILTLRKA